MKLLPSSMSLRDVGAIIVAPVKEITIRQLHPKVIKVLEELHSEGEVDEFLGDRVIPYKKVREILLRSLRG